MSHKRPAAAIYLLSLFFAALPSSARAGSVTYNVSVATPGLAGQVGYLDFQFNPGGLGAPAATATVGSFTTDGTLQPAAPQTGTAGSVSGALPGPLTLSNTSAFNDYFEGFTFGNTVGFALTLSGSTGSSAFGSSFAFSLYDNTGSNPLLTTDPLGSVLTVNLDAAGRTAVETFPQSPNNDTPVASATPTGAVPEPATLALALVPVALAVRRWLRLVLEPGLAVDSTPTDRNK